MFLWYGGRSGSSATTGKGGLGNPGRPSNADWSAGCTQNYAGVGSSVSLSGDVDGDGLADVAVGAPSFDGPQVNSGAVFIVYGKNIQDHTMFPTESD